MLLFVTSLMALVAAGAPGHARTAVRVMGSTSLVGLVEAVLPAYAQAHPDVSVHVSAGGSVAGLKAVAAGHVELGLSDVPPSWVGISGRHLVRVDLGVVPVVPIVHQGVGVADVSPAELARLLTGRIRDWKELRGRAEKVVVITRGPGSGALLVIEREVLRGQKLSDAAVVELSNGAVHRAVAVTPGAIGFVEAGFAGGGVRVLGVAGQHFRPAEAARWPYHAPAAVYYRRGAPAAVRALARALAQAPERRQFGVYGGEETGHGAAHTPQIWMAGGLDGGRRCRPRSHAGRARDLVRLGYRGCPQPLWSGAGAAGACL